MTNRQRRVISCYLEGENIRVTTKSAEEKLKIFKRKTTTTFGSSKPTEENQSQDTTASLKRWYEEITDILYQENELTDLNLILGNFFWSKLACNK